MSRVTSSLVSTTKVLVKSKLFTLITGVRMNFAGKIGATRFGDAFDPEVGLFTIGLQLIFYYRYYYGYYSLQTMVGDENSS